MPCKSFAIVFFDSHIDGRTNGSLHSAIEHNFCLATFNWLSHFFFTTTNTYSCADGRIHQPMQLDCRDGEQEHEQESDRQSMDERYIQLKSFELLAAN